MKNTYMLERPEANQVLGGLSYNGFAFWCMPFIMLLLMQGSMESLSISAGMEIAYHIINFVAIPCVGPPFTEQCPYLRRCRVIQKISTYFFHFPQNRAKMNIRNT